jgi:hypothetical protein
MDVRAAANVMGSASRKRSPCRFTYALGMEKQPTRKNKMAMYRMKFRYSTVPRPR